MSRDLHHGDRVHLDGHTTPGTISGVDIDTTGVRYTVTLDDGVIITDVPLHNLVIIRITPTHKRGDRVKVIDNRNRTQPGRITNIWTNPTNTYDIALDNGDEILDIAEIFLAPETIHDLLTPGTRIAITLRDGETHYGTIETRDTDNPSFYGITWDDGTHSTDHADDIKILLPADDPKHTTTTTTTPHPKGTRVSYTFTSTPNKTIHGTITHHIDKNRDGSTDMYRIQWDDDSEYGISTERADTLTFHPTPTFTPLVFTPRQD